MINCGSEINIFLHFECFIFAVMCPIHALLIVLKETVDLHLLVEIMNLLIPILGLEEWETKSRGNLSNPPTFLSSVDIYILHLCSILLHKC